MTTPVSIEFLREGVIADTLAELFEWAGGAVQGEDQLQAARWCRVRTRTRMQRRTASSTTTSR